MRLHVFSLVLAIITGAFSAPVIAHQQKAAITKVLFNPRTGNIEVAHRFLLHDAEHAVRQIFGGDSDIISSKRTQAIFAQYVADRFGMANSDNVEFELSVVGFEIERAFFWIYQETPTPEGGVEALKMQHNALRELWPAQVNTVNIEGLDEIKTATFEGNVEILTLDLK